MKYGIIAVLGLTLVALGALHFGFVTPADFGLTKRGAPHYHVRLPLGLSPAAKLGQGLFRENCMMCHGKNASGSENGPPLVHQIYGRKNVADFSFYRAVSVGVKAHNWKFGDMPPVDDVNQNQARLIVEFVRELQKENGIF